MQDQKGPGGEEQGEQTHKHPGETQQTEALRPTTGLPRDKGAQRETEPARRGAAPQDPGKRPALRGSRGGE